MKMMKDMPEEALAMVDRMYGGAMIEYIAFVGDRCLISFGKGGDKLIRQAIDVAKGDAKGLAGDAQYQAAVADLPDQRIAEGFFSPSQFITMFSKMGLPGVMPLEVTPGKPLSMWTMADKSGVVAEVHIPSSEVKAIYTAIMQAMMGAMMGGGAGGMN